MIGSACTWRYRSILSLLQLPMRLIMSLPTPEQRSAMALEGNEILRYLHVQDEPIMRNFSKLMISHGN